MSIIARYNNGQELFLAGNSTTIFMVCDDYDLAWCYEAVADFELARRGTWEYGPGHVRVDYYTCLDHIAYDTPVVELAPLSWGRKFIIKSRGETTLHYGPRLW